MCNRILYILFGAAVLFAVIDICIEYKGSRICGAFLIFLVDSIASFAIKGSSSVKEDQSSKDIDNLTVNINFIKENSPSD